MRSIRSVCVALLAMGVLCVASQADAGLRRSRGMRTAYAPWPPAADKAKTDKKADATPATEQPMTTTRRRGLFKRRYVTQGDSVVATPVAFSSASPFKMVSDPTPAPSSSATPTTPAPAPAAKTAAKPKRRLFARWRARRGKA